MRFIDNTGDYAFAWILTMSTWSWITGWPWWLDSISLLLLMTIHQFINEHANCPQCKDERAENPNERGDKP